MGHLLGLMRGFMPVFTQFSLLKNRRFVPLLLVQFLGAFNDNVFKNALIILITYQLITQSELLQQLSVTFAAGLFILPFFLFKKGRFFTPFPHP